MKSNSKKQLPLAGHMLLSAAVAAGLAGVASAQPIPGINAGARGARGGGGLQTTPINASSDARTNTVVITGPTDQLKQIEDLIHQIDSNPVADNVVYVYKLKNGSSLNVEAVANMLFNGTGGNNRGVTTGQTLGTGRVSSSATGLGGAGGARGATGARGAGGVAGGLGTTGGVTGRGAGGLATAGGITGSTAGSAVGLMGQVTVIADPNTNSLLVSTNPKNWERVKLILDELDRSVPQVLIKVLIAEVTHDDSLDLGADLSFMNMRLDSAGSLTEGVQTGSLFGTTGFPSGQGGIFQIKESQFSATIRALDTTGKLDVLSRPYILASDNQLATITVGQTVPYVTGSTISGDTGGVTNTVNYSNVGILLDVIPHINPDGMVILDVAPQVSALLDSRIQISADVQAPVFSNRSAQTRVAVENNQTVVIGGLMQDQKNSVVSKVPLLGDVPWLGQLFRSTKTTKTKTELLIFLTPHVAARPDMLQAMQEDEVKHTKLIENSVAPGVFQDQMGGMQAGQAPATSRPAVEQPHPLVSPEDQMKLLQEQRQQEQQMQQQFEGGRGGRGGAGGRGGGRGGRGAPPPIEIGQ
jgi:general secretion pathway protein D